MQFTYLTISEVSWKDGRTKLIGTSFFDKAVFINVSTMNNMHACHFQSVTCKICVIFLPILAWLLYSREPNKVFKWPIDFVARLVAKYGKTSHRKQEVPFLRLLEGEKPFTRCTEFINIPIYLIQHKFTYFTVQQHPFLLVSHGEYHRLLFFNSHPSKHNSALI